MTIMGAEDTKSIGQQGNRGSQKGRMLIYLGIIILVAIIAVVYLLSPTKNASFLSIYNLSNPNLTQNQRLFLEDLQNVSNADSLSISYSAGRTIQLIPYSNNVIVVSASSDNFISYRLGSEIKSIFNSNFTQIDQSSNTLITKNDTSLYFYSTSNGTMACAIDDKYMNSTSNFSIRCQRGDAGLSFLEQFPSVPTNSSSIIFYLTIGNTSYVGQKSFIGRSCDDFHITNETTSPANYTTAEICIDKQYGVPLYLNMSDVAGGSVTSGSTLVATSITTNVSASEFVIPAKFLNNVSSGTI